MNYIFHHSDPDGYFAAALFLYRFDKAYLKFIEMSHPDEPNHPDITKNDNVYIVDYNPGSIANLENLCAKASHVIWIDHHVSSYNKFKDVKIKNLSYHYNNNECSSCEQVYYYLYLYNDEIIKTKYDLIKYISDYDSWKNKYPESTSVFYGTLTVESPEQAFEYLDKPINDIINTGQIIFDYIKYQATQLKGFEGKISKSEKDYTILIKNTHLKGTFLFTDKEKEDYDFVCVVNLKNGITEILGSIYSIKYDCSELVTYYNIGGGHKGASGFTCSLNTFELLFVRKNNA